MAKVKYYYDSDTLSYQKIKTKKGQHIQSFLITITASFLFMIIVFVVFTPVFDSPKDKELKLSLIHI